MDQTNPFAVQRLRHPLKLRTAQVDKVVPLNPHMVRITFRGDELGDFISASFDDHVKVFFPAPGESLPRLPTMGADGPMFVAEEARPIARDYTPRRYDAEHGELDIEFVLHDAGPASIWAAQAQVGQMLGIGGPRGSLVIPSLFDWHLLIGDETALPAIARRLEELPAAAQAIVILEVADSAVRLPLASSARLSIRWLNRDGATGSKLVSVLRELALPEGEGYVWAAGELSAMQAVRKHLVEERGIDKSRIRAASYWKRGAIASHETLAD